MFFRNSSGIRRPGAEIELRTGEKWQMHRLDYWAILVNQELERAYNTLGILLYHRLRRRGKPHHTPPKNPGTHSVDNIRAKLQWKK